MKATSFLLAQPVAESLPAAPVAQMQPAAPFDQTDSREWIRHILFGSPENVRRTIHQLHSLGYANATLWSPPIHPDSPLLIEPKPDEVMRLLRKQM